MDVVAEEACRAPLEAPRPPGKPVGIRVDFRHIVFGTDRHRTERPRMRVRRALVIDRDVEESCGTEGFARRLDLLQMAAKRLFPLIEAEHGLKYRRCSTHRRRVLRERVIQAMPDGSLERLVPDPPPAR